MLILKAETEEVSIQVEIWSCFEIADGINRYIQIYSNLFNFVNYCGNMNIVDACGILNISSKIIPTVVSKPTFHAKHPLES